MREILTTEHAATLQGSRFAAAPLQVHEAVLCALSAIGSCDSIPTNATDGQRRQSERMRERIPDLLDGLHSLLRPLSGPSWRTLDDEDAIVESFSSLSVLKATHDLWSDRRGEEVPALRRSLMSHRQIMSPSPQERQGWLQTAYQTAEGWRGDQGSSELAEAAAVVFTGARHQRMHGVVGHLAAAYLYAGAGELALARAYEWCAFLYDGPAPAFTPPRRQAVTLGPRHRLSLLAEAR